MKGGTIEKVKNKSQNDNTRRVGYVQHGKGETNREKVE
jgi:hypothetical protein